MYKKLLILAIALIIPIATFGATLEEQCQDGLDNNSNNLLDLQDPACQNFRPICVLPQTINPVGTLPSNWCINPPPVDLCPEEGVQTELPCATPPTDLCPEDGIQAVLPCAVVVEPPATTTPPEPPAPPTPPVSTGNSKPSGGGGGMIVCSGPMAPGYISGLPYGGCENLKPKGNPLQLQLVASLEKLIELLNLLLKLK